MPSQHGTQPPVACRFCFQQPVSNATARKSCLTCLPSVCPTVQSDPRSPTSVSRSWHSQSRAAEIGTVSPFGPRQLSLLWTHTASTAEAALEAAALIAPSIALPLKAADVHYVCWSVSLTLLTQAADIHNVYWSVCLTLPPQAAGASQELLRDGAAAFAPCPRGRASGGRGGDLLAPLLHWQVVAHPLSQSAL